MSRIAKNPLAVPEGVEITIEGQHVTAKGSRGTLDREIHRLVEVRLEDGILTVHPRNNSTEAWAQAGTAMSLIRNMAQGVSEGFERRLALTGVGYRAQVQGNTLNLTLGFSHPVTYELPDNVAAETPSQTEIVIKGMDKQAVGQVAANVRGFRPPEPYKGKGVRYADENVQRKEAKKK